MNNQSQTLIGVTGSTGALGQRLVEMLIDKGFRVRCLVRDPKKAQALLHLGTELSQGDVTARESLLSFVTGLDVCIHLAALVGRASAEQYRKVNADGTENLCGALKMINPSCRLIHCSTISAIKAKNNPTAFTTDYGKSKLAADSIVETYRETHDLKATIIYPGLIYGPYDRHFLPVLIRILKKGKVFLVSGGESKGPVIYVDDLCDLIILAAENPNSIGRKYLGVGDLRIGIHDFIRLLADKVDTPVSTFRIPKFFAFSVAISLEWMHQKLKLKGEPALTKRVVGLFSISFNEDLNNFHRNLGWQPKITAAEGIDKALKLYTNP